MSLAKALLFFALTQTGSIACVVDAHAQTTQGRQPDLQRGVRNYQDIISGRKKLDQLTPQEQQEVLAVHRRIKAKKAQKANLLNARTPKTRRRLPQQNLPIAPRSYATVPKRTTIRKTVVRSFAE
jgi:hypothetical protein